MRLIFGFYYFLSAKLAMSHSISSKPIDTGAGFYLDEEDLIDEQFEEPKLVETPRKLHLFIIKQKF